MIISMQGNWKVVVKSKSAAFDQQFVIAGATSGNGTHPGVPGTTVHVTGNQWTIAVRANPGTGFQLSDAKITFPHIAGGRYEFDILSNDSGGDQDFNDLILTCSTPATINDFVIYGNVSLYSGRCIFNPCRRGPWVIDTYPALLEALRNKYLHDAIAQLYPDRIPDLVNPNPPDPPPDFKPIVIDLFGEATRARTVLLYKQLEQAGAKSARAKTEEALPELALQNFSLVKSMQTRSLAESASISPAVRDLARAIDSLYIGCSVDPAPNLTLTFEEYDRTAAELAGGAYTGTGNRQLLGDTITDMFGNYIFRFTFDMTFPFIDDAADIAPGESINVVAYPDVIVKVTGFSPSDVLYESAPYYNIPNLKRIDLCLPKSSVPASAVCFNGSLIGSLGNVFIGGNQNSAASTAAAALRRYGDNNYLEADGKITVHNSQALFAIECAAWTGTIDMRGCMYDAAKPVTQNNIHWYTIRIRRAGTWPWTFVSENYKHPKYSKRNLPNYNGDDVGPFATSLHVDGGPAVTVPAYMNIQRQIFVDGVDWEFSNFDRYIQLNTALYDLVAGVRTPGTYYVRVDCYDGAGNLVPNATDLVALFVHNLPLQFSLGAPHLTDPSVLYSGCGLYRLTDGQMNTPMELAFVANDPYGFVDSYALTMGRCPAPMLALRVNSPKPPLADTLSGATTLAHGDASANLHHACPGYTGTLADFSTAGLVTVNMQPALSEGGWIKLAEYFTVLSFTLTAYMRVTNGYNTGLSGQYYAGTSIYMERLTA